MDCKGGKKLQKSGQFDEDAHVTSKYHNSCVTIPYNTVIRPT